MAVFQVKKYKLIKDENGNKIQVNKTKEEWNRETKNGSMTWYFSTRYKVNNETKQYKSKLFALKREAEEQERLFLNDPIDYIKEHSKRAKIDVVEDKIEDSAKKLDEYYNDFFEYDLKHNKESTAYEHKLKYFKHVSPVLGSKIPKEIELKDINHFHTCIEDKISNQNTKISINASLSKFLDYLKVMGIVEINYAKAYGSFKKVNDEVIEIEKEIKYQTIEEFELFMHNVTDTYWYAFFNFLFWHGLRKGEQQAITWKDIDFENEVVKINKTVSKSKSGGIKITNTKNKWKMQD